MRFLHGAVTVHPWLYRPLLDLGGSSVSPSFTRTFGGTPWTVVQPVVRPLPAHRGQHIHRIKEHTDINVSGGIRTHDPFLQADSSCLRPREHCDRLVYSNTHP
jgi:hypothetical protein